MKSILFKLYYSKSLNFAQKVSKYLWITLESTIQPAPPPRNNEGADGAPLPLCPYLYLFIFFLVWCHFQLQWKACDVF